MTTNTSAIRAIEEKLAGVEEGSFRHQVLLAARSFKTSWIDLARYLHCVQRDRMYKEWGFLTFEGYCSKEIGIRRATASKLLLSYRYLEKEEPDFLSLDGVPTANVPSPEAVGILRRARKSRAFSEDDLRQLREDVMVEGKDHRDVYSRFKSLKEAADPEAARMESRALHMRRLIAGLQSVRKEGEILRVVPRALLKAIDELIARFTKEADSA